MNKVILIILVVLIAEVLIIFFFRSKIASLNQTNKSIIYQIPTFKILPTIQVPSPTPTEPKKINKINKIIIPTPKPTDSEPWGVSRQINEHTWTIKIGEDQKMATSKEIFDALNEYRKVHSSQVLTWDEKLVNYAQERAVYLNGKKSVDQHAGFDDFLNNQDGFNKLGFTSLGENISYGFRLNGTHVIEWMYAGDKPHNDNQVDNRWNYVGIGVNGLATCLIFGTGKF